MGEEDGKISWDEMIRIGEEQRQKRREEHRKQLAEERRIGFHMDPRSMRQEAIDFTSKKETAKKLTIAFPEALYIRNEPFPLHTLDFSPLEALKKLEYVQFQYLRTDSLLPILEHIPSVTSVSLLKTGPVTSPLLKELRVVQNLEYLQIAEPPESVTADTLAPLGDFRSLQKLRLSGMNMDCMDFPFLRALTALSSLRFSEFRRYHGRYVQKPFQLGRVDLTYLEACHELQELVIAGIDISTMDLSPLSQCQQLQSLELCANALIALDLSPLAECPITILSLGDFGPRRWGNKLSSIDLSPLAERHTLQHLRLDHNEFRRIDLVPLAECKLLQDIDLSHNRLEEMDLSPLSGCEQIEKIDLNNNRLREIDLSPLLTCPEMNSIDLSDNRLTAADTSMFPEPRFYIRLR